MLDYGEDWRVARLRLSSSEQARRRSLIGRTWTDVGRTAICDLDTLVPKRGTDNAAYAKIAAWIESEAPFGVALFGESNPSPIPYVESGFGDGDYPVNALVNDHGRRVGFEVRFLSPRYRYSPQRNTGCDHQSDSISANLAEGPAPTCLGANDS